MRSIGLAIALLCLSVTGSSAQVPDYKAILDLWSEAYHKGDAASVSKLYAEDAVMTGATGRRSDGRSAIETALQRAMATTKSRRLTMKDTKRREYGNIAIQNDTWDLDLVSQDDKTSSYSGRSSVVYYRTPQGWWIIVHHIGITPRT